MHELMWVGALIRERMIDELTEAELGNLTLDEEWRKRTIKWLLLAKEDPWEWLRQEPCLPGSHLEQWKAQNPR